MHIYIYIYIYIYTHIFQCYVISTKSELSGIENKITQKWPIN